MTTMPTTPFARQAAAAELWLKLGKQPVSSVECEKEAMSKLADELPRGPSVEARRGLGVGATIGAGLMGLAAHRAGPAVHTSKAMLGGAVVGGGLGGGAGLVQGVRRFVRDLEEPAQKTAGAYEGFRTALSRSPEARAAVGAAAVGLPMAGIGYALERRRHTPTGTGDSLYRAGTRLDQDRHQAQAGAGGGSRLRSLYLGLRDQAAEEASRSPRAAGALGGMTYAVPGAIAGAALGSRILR